MFAKTKSTVMKSITIQFKAIIGLLLAVLLSGCSERIASFTMTSTKQTNIKFDKSKGVRVTGKSMAFMGMGASIDEAIDKALQSAGQDYDVLLDAVVKVKSYPFVGGYVVEGIAMQSSKMGATILPYKRVYYHGRTVYYQENL